MNPNFGPVAIIAALSLFLPLPWHWRARNIATLSIIAWLFVINIIYAVDSFVWSNSVDDILHTWCDITTKLIVGANFALPAACLCICIHLESVASVRMARSSGADKRRRQWFELTMCLGLPIIFMALHYIVQGHRYDIIEGHGCRPTTYFSIPSIFIVWLPPILLSTAAVVYAGLALRHFMIRRISFAAHLNSSNSALTPSRYLRLMTMSALQMVCSITITSYNLWFTTISIPFRPWTDWADVHFNFSRVDAYPDEFTPPFAKRAFYVIWWFVPVSTFLFVGFFSFGQDAMDEYRKCFMWIRVKVLRMQPHDSKSIPLAKSKNLRSLAISSPMQSKAMESGVTDSTPPAYSPSGSSFSVGDKRPVLSQYLSSDTQSEITRYEPHPYIEGKAIGSVTDLALSTPTAYSPTTVGPLSPNETFIAPELTTQPSLPPPQPITPPPVNPRRLRDLVLVPSSPTPSRPLTYPSFDAHLKTVHHPQSFP